MLDQLELKYLEDPDSMATVPISRKMTGRLKKSLKSHAGISTNNLISTAYQGAQVASPIQATGLTIDRLPKHLQETLRPVLNPAKPRTAYLKPNAIYEGDARHFLPQIEPNSVSVSVWSPPYFVGKSYESGMSFDEWKELLREVVALHFPIIKPGGFLVINIADILCFRDRSMPKIQAEAVSRRRSPVTLEDVLKAMEKHPGFNRYLLAKLLNCSEQTIDRRLNGNNIRGGKYETQTRVKIVGGLVEDWALRAGFHTHDRRVWVKDAAWENSRWASLSYRSVDEFEYLYFFWKPGITKVDRSRLTRDDWRDWGSRGVWTFPSVRANDDHEAKFPVELPRRVIRLLTEPGEIVLDCFIGSGTSAVAAIEENRRYIGIELISEYAKIARRSCEKASQPKQTALPG